MITRIPHYIDLMNKYKGEKREIIMTPSDCFQNFKNKIKPVDYYAFFSTFVIGLFAHMRIFLQDIPNHDGVNSIFFDQNMITSGRWFLRVACGISTDYTLPWLIGVLVIFYISVAAVVLVRFFNIEHRFSAVLIGGLFASYPVLASNFAYIFTADGYMLALLLAVLSVYFTSKYKRGFIVGGICLGFSMGIYQAYLSFAMILSLYAVCRILLHEKTWKDKVQNAVRYLYMGVLGGGIYFVMLQILLFIQQTELSGYQGIGSTNTLSLVDKIILMYRDFIVHSLAGNILTQNIFHIVMLGILMLGAFVGIFCTMKQKGKFKDYTVYIGFVGAILMLPTCFNIVLFISPQVQYHSLMRMQWVLIPISMIAIIDQTVRFKNKTFNACVQWGTIVGAVILIWGYIEIDNIAYFNLEKKYDKTYTYITRLLDRMEETPGYEHGMEVAMIGVVGDDYLPSTDMTVGVTDNLLGVNGDYLFYTAENYRNFIKYYFGVEIELIDMDLMTEITQSEEYHSLNTFPKQKSMKVVDGVLYIKLENEN